MTWAPMSWRSAGVTLLTDAWVPTGMNCGVSIPPCGVSSLPRRARPMPVGRLLKLMGPFGIELQDSRGARRFGLNGLPLRSEVTRATRRLAEDAVPFRGALRLGPRAPRHPGPRRDRGVRGRGGWR